MTPQELAALPENGGTDISITCPFCLEDDFDKIGLKHHIANHCEAWASIKDIL